MRIRSLKIDEQSWTGEDNIITYNVTLEVRRGSKGFGNRFSRTQIKNQEGGIKDETKKINNIIIRKLNSLKVNNAK